MSTERAGLRDSFRGALLGSVVGEALGRPYDGWSAARLQREVGEVREIREASGPAEGSACMAALAESMVGEEGFEPAVFAARLAASPHLFGGLGRGLTDVVRRLRANESWETAPFHIYPRGSFGNGAAVRIAPVAILLFDRDEDLPRLAEESALVTHAHPLGIAGAILQARQIALAVANQGKEIDPIAMAVTLLSATESTEFRKRLRAVEKCLDENADTKTLRGRLGFNATALGSVPAALYCFLTGLASFEDAVVLAASLGGATASITGMTGAIAGAYHGVGAIPRRWRERVSPGVLGADPIERLADRLLERHVDQRRA
jgi:poly(ADP-ribose) glycohydrolase ARH3